MFTIKIFVWFDIEKERQTICFRSIDLYSEKMKITHILPYMCEVVALHNSHTFKSTFLTIIIAITHTQTYDCRWYYFCTHFANIPLFNRFHLSRDDDGKWEWETEISTSIFIHLDNLNKLHTQNTTKYRLLMVMTNTNMYAYTDIIIETSIHSFTRKYARTHACMLPCTHNLIDLNF